MKKLLLSIVIILICVLIGITVARGFNIGKITILGIKDIKNKDEELDEKIRNATKLASTDYQKKIDDLNTAIKKLKTEKSNYEEMVNVSTDSEVEAANQSYENMIEFLLVRIENHAKSEGVTIDLAITGSSSGAENMYNLNFTATGAYVGIEEFITDIEDDSKLGYKIEEFKMTSSSEDGGIVKATFVCKDISIQGISSNSIDIQNNSDKTNEDSTENNTDTTTNTTETNTTETSTAEE